MDDNNSEELKTCEPDVDSLIKFIRCLGDTHRDVVHILAHSNDDIKYFRRELLLDYNSCTQKALRFLNTLQHWLDGFSGSLAPSKTDQLYANLSEIVNEHAKLSERLLEKKQELDVRNTGRLKAYKAVSGGIVASVYTLELVCVVASVIPGVPKSTAATAGVTSDIMRPGERAKEVRHQMLEKYKTKQCRRSEFVSALMEAMRAPLRLLTVEDLQAGIKGLQDKFQMVGDMEIKMIIKQLQTEKDGCYKQLKDATGKITAIAYEL